MIWIKRIFWLVLLLAAAGAVIFWLLRDNDKAAVVKVMRNICGMTDKQRGESGTLGLIKIGSADKWFADRCEIDVNYGSLDGTMSPQEITALLARARGAFEEMRGTMSDLEITLHDDRQQSTAYFSGEFYGLPKGGGAPVREVRDLECRLQKIDGKWKVIAVRVRRVLER